MPSPTTHRVWNFAVCLSSALAACLLACTPSAPIAQPASVTVIGSLQSELGCPGDWQPDCAATHLSYDPFDAVWQGVSNLPAGSWDYKAALDDAFDENYGLGAVLNGPNIPLTLATGAAVKFYYSHETHWITDDVNSTIAVAAGSFQSELGCAGDWQPDCLRSWLQDPDGDGTLTFSTSDIPAGDYDALVPHGESWNETYGAGGVQGGPNIPFSVPAGATVHFEYDLASHVLTIQVEVPPWSPGYAIVHYFRADGDYGDHTTGDFDDFWGLHLWGSGIQPSEATEWTSPKPFLGEDEYGRFAWVKLLPGATEVNFILHRGDIKDGTAADRSFDPSLTPEIWLVGNDGTEYASQAEAQGFVTIHYRRADGDYGNPSSPDFNDFWGLHLWGDGLDPSEVTGWTAPKRPDGFDGYGAFFEVALQDASFPINFIVHRGDSKDTSFDRSFEPLVTPSIWLQSGEAPVYPQQGAAEDFVAIHYHRDAGDYGNASSPDFDDFWGLHVWTGAANPTEWQNPIRPAYQDVFGVTFLVDVIPGASELAYILHRGDAKDPGPDQILELTADGHEVWQLEDADPADPYILPIAGVPAPPPLQGDIDGDGDVDEDDVDLVFAARGTPADGPDDPRDIDGDGLITVNDARALVLLCTWPTCATN